jgi:hypothetical protein
VAATERDHSRPCPAGQAADSAAGARALHPLPWRQATPETALVQAGGTTAPAANRRAAGGRMTISPEMCPSVSPSRSIEGTKIWADLSSSVESACCIYAQQTPGSKASAKQLLQLVLHDDREVLTSA